MSEPTVESVRDELRGAIFDCLFYEIGLKIEQREADRELVQQRACGFIIFGVNSRLFSPEEGNDWLDAVWGRQVLAKVAQKYMKEGKSGDQEGTDRGSEGRAG